MCSSLLQGTAFTERFNKACVYDALESRLNQFKYFIGIFLNYLILKTLYISEYNVNISIYLFIYLFIYLRLTHSIILKERQQNNVQLMWE